MASYGWRKTAAVRTALFEEGQRFSFFQAVSLLEALYPERESPGETLEPEREVVRFTSRVGFDFPAGEIDSVREPRDGEPAHMRVNVLGLAGELGPLPQSLSELILDRLADGDETLRDFLDLFNHRLLSLYYRARKKYRPALTHRPPHEGRVAGSLFSFLGLGIPELRDRQEVADRALLPYTSLLLSRPRTMIGLEQLLADYFQTAAEVIPFRGRWLELEADDVTRIGGPGTGRNHALGREAMIGRRAWDQAGAFDVRLGPLERGRPFDFLPTGAGFKALVGLVRFYVDDQLPFDVCLRLRPAEVPPLRLGAAGDSRLGWSLRLGDPARPRPTGPGAPRREPPLPRTAEPRLGGAGGSRLGWTSWLPATAPGGEAEIRLRGAS